MSGELSAYAIYERPLDYPEGYVARRFTVDARGALPTADAYFGPTLESVRAHVRPGRVRISRSELDEPQIVETWL